MLFFPTRIIARPKDSGFGNHWGIQLFTGVVAHLMPEGVQVVTLEKFAKGRPVTEIKPIDPRRAGDVYQRVEASQWNPWAYDLFERNCEHYATAMAGDVQQSPQVKGWGAILLAGAAIWVMSQAG